MLRTRIAAVIVAAPLALAGCSGDATPPPAAPASTAASAGASASSPQPGDQVDETAFFENVQKAMLSAKTYSMTMRMGSGGEAMTMTGTGDVGDQRRPKADMSISVPGGSGPMRMIMDGDAVYMQMPGGAGGGKFVKMPMESLSQASGQDLGKLMNPAENLQLTRDAVEKVVYQGTEDQAGEQLAHYSVTMNPQKLQQQLMTSQPAPSPSAMPSELPYEVWLDSANRVRKMTMTVEGTQMTMTVDKYGQPVSIAAPPQASVTQMPGMSDPSAPATPAPTTATATG